MNNKIIVSELFTNGLTENNGLILRNKIKELLKDISEEDTIIIDFSNITLFATPFFNSSIGYFILNLGPEKVFNLIKLENISELGLSTYTHSVDNASEIYKKKMDPSAVGDITKNNIENS